MAEQQQMRRSPAAATKPVACQIKPKPWHDQQIKPVRRVQRCTAARMDAQVVCSEDAVTTVHGLT
jgi:hypothetical protein